MKPKRINKTKEEISQDMIHIEKVKKLKTLVREIFPLLSKQESVYNAQTVVTALSGYINADIEEKNKKLKISDLSIDLSNEADNEITNAMLAIKELIQDEMAEDTSSLLEKLGQAFSAQGAEVFLKGPVSNVDIEDIIK